MDDPTPEWQVPSATPSGDLPARPLALCPSCGAVVAGGELALEGGQSSPPLSTRSLLLPGT